MIIDHIGVAVSDYAVSKAFYTACLKPLNLELIVEVDGKPGLREVYHPDYYGALVIDPDGHNLEAVCHTPETGVV